MNAPFQIRQIAQYPRVGTLEAGFVALVQSGEAGTPYVSVEASDFVATALADGGRLLLNSATGGIIFGPPNIILNAVSGGFVFSANVTAPSITAPFIDTSSVSINGFPAVTAPQLQAVADNTVTSFNQRQGDVLLEQADILRAGGAPQANPVFSGWVVAPSHWDPRLSDDTVATANWVQRAICAALEALLQLQVVTTFNGRFGAVTLLTSDVNSAFAVPGPPFPSSQNPPFGDASNRIATTLFVDESITDLESRITQDIQDAIPVALAGYAPINSPQFTGTPTAPTPAPGNSSGDIATTAFVHNAIVASTTGVASFNTRTGAVVLASADITAAGGALLVSPAFTGIPTAPTPAPGNNSTEIATTAFVDAAIATVTAGVTSFNTRTGAVTLSSTDITGAGGALIASPAFTGNPTAVTQTLTDSSTRLATTAFVQGVLASLGTGVTSFNGRTGAVTFQANDISAVGGALLAGPTFTGVPQAPTAAPGTNTNQLATTAFVAAALTSLGVTSFNGRTGAVTMILADVTGAGGAPIASPAFTGTPSAPTPSQAVNDNTLATTAFVHSALSTAGGVSSFNGRAGAVTLVLADVTGAGGAPLASPTFTGVPAGPTAAPGTSTTQLATTAFVAAATAASVSSFNGRTGAVTFQANDISAVGGALLAGPAFTGNPTATTQVAGTNNTTLATTAFVQAALSTAGGVITFNGRAGAVTLTSADITGAGGALLASPTFTGVPAAPTATAGTSTTQIATTAFVTAAVSSGGAPLDATTNPFTLAATTAGGSLTIALKNASGADPTSVNPVTIGVRSVSGITGVINPVTITAPTSFTIPSGATLGVPAATAFRIWVVIMDTGTLAAIVCGAVGYQYIAALNESDLINTTAVASGSNSAGTFYSSATWAGRSYRIVGYLEWSSGGLATAGTWNTTNLVMNRAFGPGISRPGHIVSSAFLANQAGGSNATTTFVTTNNITAQITSAANLIRLHVDANVSTPAVSGVNMQIQTRTVRGGAVISSARSYGLTSASGPNINFYACDSIDTYDRNTAGAVIYSYQIAAVGAGTVISSGVNLRVDEIMQ